MMGIITQVQRFSVFDGPGIRTAVFLKGCPLRCRWCHNPECLSMEIQEHVKPSLAGQTTTVAQVMEEVLRDKAYYDADGGLTITGGEPLMQADFSAALLNAAKMEGIHTCVETCGAGDLSPLLADTDLFLWDYKATGEETHLLLTGFPQAPILRNLKRVLSANKRVILRCPIVPTQNDTPEHFAGIQAVLLKHPQIERCELMAYHNLGSGKYKALGLSYALDGLPNMTEEQKTAALQAVQNGISQQVIWG